MNKIELPEEVFRYRSAYQQISDEQEQMTPVLRFSWADGIKLWLKGAEYPQKSMATPEVMWSINFAKRNLMAGVRLFSKWYFWIVYVLFILMPWKTKKRAIEDFLETYIDVSWRPVSPFVLKTEHMTGIAQELEWLVYTFLNNLGIKKELAEKMGEIFASCIEFDTAYRYRLEDVLHETSKTDLLKSPVKESRRLFDIFASREADGNVKRKFLLVKGILFALLSIKRLRQAFKLAIEEVDLRKMGLDEIDMYWVCLRKDGYNYLGKSNEERRKMLEGKSLPELIDKKEIGL